MKQDLLRFYLIVFIAFYISTEAQIDFIKSWHDGSINVYLQFIPTETFYDCTYWAVGTDELRHCAIVQDLLLSDIINYMM